MINVMHDLETLGVDAGSTILSIGAVVFGPGGISGTFYSVINRQTCRNAGLTEDPDTLEWWRNQSPEARVVLTDAANLKTSSPLGRALAEFDTWLLHVGAGDQERKNVKIWGNGADFDKPILGAAFKTCGFAPPWTAYSCGCYRTLKNLRPEIKLIRTGTAHNALVDAQDQAEHAIRLLDDLKGW